LHDNTRKTDYTLAINYIQNHVLWGCGYQQQTTALREQEEVMKDVLPKILNKKCYVHNQLLGDMVQFGIWGGLALLALFFGIIFYAIKKRSYPLLMFILTMILFMQIEEPLYRQAGITRFSVFLVYFVALAQSKEKVKFFDLYGWLCEKITTSKNYKGGY
jgi:O-antigen ligase